MSLTPTDLNRILQNLDEAAGLAGAASAGLMRAARADGWTGVNEPDHPFVELSREVRHAQKVLQDVWDDELIRHVLNEMSDRKEESE